MDSPDVSRAALERLLTPPEGDRMELIVTYRRYDDYEAYEREIADLRQRYQRVQDEVYRWQLWAADFLRRSMRSIAWRSFFGVTTYLFDSKGGRLLWRS